MDKQYPPVTIESTTKILKSKPVIPYYQRPYSWDNNHVAQLLEDIVDNMRTGKTQEKCRLRLGTVILYNATNGKEIVDGQQRLVTLSMILYYLSEDENISPLLTANFPHADSKVNITKNYKDIRSWFENKGYDNAKKNEIQNFILNDCEFVLIELQNISEAFQLFDSQNARGKALKPYDLLKVFHLREMANNTEEERYFCVKQWENSVNDRTLENLGKYFYRIRKWAKGQRAYSFTKDEIDEFKGFNLNQCQYPYLKSYFFIDVIVDGYNKDRIISNIAGINYPFQINQLIINEKRFFEYVIFYSKLYTELFKSEFSDFSSFYNRYCFYDGHTMTGDRFVREMFEAICLFYIDKFGKEVFTRDVYITLYKWCYRLRLLNGRVFYTSLDKYITESGNNLFEKINSVYYPEDALKNINIQISDEINYKKRPMIEEIFGKKGRSI